MGSLIVHTARLGVRDPDLFDITRRGAREHLRAHGVPGPGEPWAPPEWLLRAAKGYPTPLPYGVSPPPEDLTGFEGWCWYREHFLDHMRRSYRLNRAAWDALLARDRVVLACFCADVERCHRGLVASALVACGACAGGEIAGRVTERLEGQLGLGFGGRRDSQGNDLGKRA